MLRSVPMVHFRVQVPNRDGAAATRAIASEGLLHLVDIAHGKTPYDASPPGVRELYASFRDLVHRIRNVSARLGVARTEPVGAVSAAGVTDFSVELEKILLLLEPIEKEVDELSRRSSEMQEKIANTRERLEHAERMRSAALEIDRLSSLRFAAVRLGIAPPEALASVSAVVSPAPHAIVPLQQSADGVLFAAVAPAAFRNRIDEAMRLAVAVPVALPSSPADVDIASLTGELSSCERTAAEIDRELDDVRSRNAETLENIARRSEIGMLLLQAQTHFAAAGRFIVISGWVPRASAQRLKERVRSATSDHAIVDIEAAESIPGFSEGTLRVPILHQNPLLLRPFQKLIDIYGTPSYKEVEPTAFFAISFLLMFGLMFGDVGHGAVLFSAGWLLFRYLPRFFDYGILLMEAGASSTLFGFLYGSIFGIRGLIPTLWMEPLEDLSRFMLIAVAFGAVIVTAGLVLNIVNSWRAGDFSDAISGPKGIAGTLLYWVILVVIARAVVPANVRIPGAVIAALVAVAVVLLAATPPIVKAIGKRGTRRPKPPVRTTPWFMHALEASVELVDTLFSYFANTISFVRIAAFAALHCGIFLAIFALADTLGESRIGGVLAIAVHVAGNILVIFLEGLTVSVQVLRLEYYEFFGKFFRGGGEAYAPLALPEIAPPPRERKHSLTSHARSHRHA